MKLFTEVLQPTTNHKILWSTFG